MFRGSGAAYPDTGEFLVTGANNASILLTALSSVAVQLDSDIDGDDVVDETIIITWDLLIYSQTAGSEPTLLQMQ